MKKFLPLILILTLFFSTSIFANIVRAEDGAPRNSFEDVLDPSVDFVSGTAVLYDLDGKKIRELGPLSFDESTRKVTWEQPEKFQERDGVVKFEIKVKTKVERGDWDNVASVTINHLQKNTNIVNVRASTDKYYEPVKTTTARINQNGEHYVDPGEAYEYTITQKLNKTGLDYEAESYPAPMVITDALPKEVSFVSAEARINGQKVGHVSYDADTRTVTWSEKESGNLFEGNSEIDLDGSDLKLTIMVSTHEQDELTNFKWDNKARLSIGHDYQVWSNTVTVKAKRTFNVFTFGENVDIDPDVPDIPEGDSVHITFSPHEGYHIAYIEVDGEEVDLTDIEGFYDFNDIQEDHHIRVVAEKDDPDKVHLNVIHRDADTGATLAEEELGPFNIGDDYTTSHKPNGTFPGYEFVEGDAPPESYPRSGQITEFTYPVIYEYRNTDPDAVYLTIIKVDEDGNPLGDAHFLVDGKTYVTDAGDGSVKIKLHNGDYTITETQPPEGYSVINETINVHVEGDTEVTVENHKAPDMPESGQKGILIGILIGIGLIGASAISILKEKRKKKDE